MNRKIKRHKSYDYSGSQTSLLSFRRLVRPCSKTFTPAYRYYESGQRSLPFCGFRQGGRLTRRERGHRGEVTLDHRGLNKQTYCSLQRRDFIQNISRSTKFESKTENSHPQTLDCIKQMPLSPGTVVPDARESCSQCVGNPVPNVWESCSQRLGIRLPCSSMFSVCRWGVLLAGFIYFLFLCSRLSDGPTTAGENPVWLAVVQRKDGHG